uniref:EF-hand domain-containing protein n=1 Tax=Macrostomum lignano TaxID=282301 RepID=A0A1I8JQY5_9PLAT
MFFRSSPALHKNGLPVHDLSGLRTEVSRPLLFRECNEDTVKQLGTIADYDKDGLISFEEFETFEGLLSLPDHAYRIAFEICSMLTANGYVSFSEFKSVITVTTLHRQYPFNFDCDFIDLHFGKARDQIVSYEEFTQLIHDFHEEHALQAFQRSDKRNEGKIRAMDLINIMVQLKSNLLTPFLRDHLMQLLKKLIQARTGNDVHAAVTREELTNDAMSYNQLTPLECGHPVPTRQVSSRRRLIISYYDQVRPGHRRPPGAGRVETRAEGRGRTFLLSILEQVYRFSLGAIAGAIEPRPCLYPIDLRTSTVGEVLYRNSWDCFKKVIRFEGVFGLYRGLVPQLVGVAPEKAIKLTMNDFGQGSVRDKKTGFIPLWAEILAGGAAAVRPRWPARFATHRGSPPLHAIEEEADNMCIRDLRASSLVQSAKALASCATSILGDYFTLQSSEDAIRDSEGYNNPAHCCLPATSVWGAPARRSETPADVIRLGCSFSFHECIYCYNCISPQSGGPNLRQTTYTGVFDAFGKIPFARGTPGLLTKGSIARVFRSSPQPSGSNILKRPEEVHANTGSQLRGYKIATLIVR